jgi:DNA-binding NarL/FixJ family response regulator
VSQPVFVIVDNLIFLSKIQQTAKQAGIALEVIEPSTAESRLRGASAGSVILDLNHRSGPALDVLRALKGNPATVNIHVIGFLSHVQGDLAAAARAAGCDTVLARSAFAQQLPELLSKLAGGTAK